MLKCCRTLRLRARALTAAAALAALTLVLAGAAGTSAAAGGKTMRTTINLSALVLDNLCNGDVVVVSGDLHIRTTTTTHRNGGFSVASTAYAHNLRGERIAPAPPIGYHAHDGEDTHSYYAAPPQPSRHRVVHYTRLIPETPEPVMYLVVELQETVLADGTVVPVLDRAYLKCSPPQDRERG